MPRTPGTTPRPRADAQRNRGQLLAAAEVAFNRWGGAASLDDIARAAGVANATLYRHFPTREQLISAVYVERIDGLCTAAAEARASDPAGAALLGWLHAVIDHITESRGLREAFMAAYRLRDGDESPEVAEWHRRTDAAAAPLLRDAQEAGRIRPDLTVTELMTLVAAIAHAGDGDAEQARRLLGLTLEGLSR
ncbi:TetR/AcrR family transcriptional regulator [Nocardia sp. NPDC058379]|uniref:TetR/AcrR family transcriptional regulator n=1 Tax=unclassified Nocardia TaxID=2637762 RepID=UPI00365174FD